MRSYEITGEQTVMRVYHQVEDVADMLREVAQYLDDTGEHLDNIHQVSMTDDLLSMFYVTTHRELPVGYLTDLEAQMLAGAAIRYVDAFKEHPRVTSEWQSLRDMVSAYKAHQ